MGSETARHQAELQAPAKLGELRSVELYPRYVDAIVRSGLLDEVSTDDRPEFINALQAMPCRYADQKEICRENEPATCLWIVVSGAIAVQRNGNTITYRRPFEVIGEQALLEAGHKRSATLVACGQTELIAIRRSVLEALQPAYRDYVKGALCRILSGKLRQATDSRSDAAERDRDSQELLKRFFNEHQIGLILAQGPISAGNVPDAVQKQEFVFVFTDIVGFSKVAQKLPIVRTALLVRQCMNAQREAFEGAGGYIDKFMGDGVMAYFLVDGSDNRARVCADAVRAAFEAYRRVGALTQEDVPLSLRIGLHLGEALVGNFGALERMQVTLLGDQVNYAARLEQARGSDCLAGSDPILGEIRVSEALFEQLPEDLRKLLPYRATVSAKQADIPLHSGPASTK